ncbi:RHS repeat-associated core domain-containing protein [Herbiconiux sp. P18]|uniref:RHS repeat-associated core domain-containing protein n=1 Tax=Herbiconiux liangxiaofengii TaxID=3342795 RepID=UPI0035BB120A
MIRPAKTITAATLTYDPQGNITRLGDQTFTYDHAGRHSNTTVLDGAAGVPGTKVDYTRDATGAVISRTETPVTGPPTVYRYTGPFVLNGSTPVQRTLGLPGGVTVSIPISSDPAADIAARKWSYPNIHGDNTWTTDNTGTRTGFFLYDPFGQPLDQTNKVIGSATADEAIPNNLPGEYDLGWVGGKGKGYEHVGSISIIKMGMRMYGPGLGRFLAADPVAGGNTGWYNYPNDPVNMFDLDGKRQDCGTTSCNKSFYASPANVRTYGGGLGSTAKMALDRPYLTPGTAYKFLQIKWDEVHGFSYSFTQSEQFAERKGLDLLAHVFAYTSGLQAFDRMGIEPTETVKQQLACHALGEMGSAFGPADTYDLELNRPENASWLVEAPFRRV